MRSASRSANVRMEEWLGTFSAWSRSRLSPTKLYPLHSMNIGFPSRSSSAYSSSQPRFQPSTSVCRTTVRVGNVGKSARVSFSLRHSLRSEEHTSELQSRLHLVCRLLLEKKKKSLDYPCTNQFID